jgi:type IV secretory pathway TraG/TraD family ATPase VirD4
MSPPRRARGPAGANTELVLLWTAIAVVVLAGAGFTLAIHAAGAIGGDGAGLSWQPIALVADLAGGDAAWPRHSAAALVGAAVLIAGVAVGLVALIARARARRTRGDDAARLMGRGRDLAPIALAGARAKAERLGVATPGLPVGRTVAGNRPLYQGWEDVAVDIAGPRTGKTTGRVIPAIMEAPGCVLTTSNKRDVVDATRAVREAVGPVWVFDPQQVAEEPASWWWNPLSYAADERTAENLAEVFAAASAAEGARRDAFFDPKGQKVVAALLLAGAAGGRDMAQVYRWVARPSDDEPVELLREHGYDLYADSLSSEIHSPDRQRGGVYGTAEKILGFLTNRATLGWITPAPDRPGFDPHQFVAGAGTLYSLSKEGRGSAGALVAALTVAVTEAAEELARRSPAGRLARPMVVVLDEAANVCRWPELPNLYSHYGSRGIVLMTMLQSWSQGVAVWGQDGMRKLWSAATLKLYGGGVAEVEFLSDLSQLIGQWNQDTVSVSRGRGGRNATVSTQRERIMEVADLAGLPRGRAVVLASGTPATLTRVIPWMDGPHAETIRAAIAAGPTTSTTLEGANPWLS